MKGGGFKLASTVPENLLGLPLGSESLIGGRDDSLSNLEVSQFISRAFDAVDFSGKKVLLILPDATRSCPMPTLLPQIYKVLEDKAGTLTALIALGTHAAMTNQEIDRFFAGSSTVKNLFPKMTFLNHEWWKPDQFAQIGNISAQQVREISAGVLEAEVPVIINRIALESDLIIIVGPVFPHEVVGFSGGAKYLFPGISGKAMIDASHWLGAIISSSQIIGTPGITPVREMINLAAGKLETEMYSLCLVVQSGSAALEAMAFGKPHSAWQLASDVSSQTHIHYVEKPVKRVLSIIPERYADIWTAAKGMYKVDPIIEDGGEVIIYAPHVSEFAYTHPELEEIGYHCRAYFTEQWERFKNFPTSVLAHSAHLRGSGTYTKAEGEKCRITVTLATGISEERVRKMNLNYLNPSTMDISKYESEPETFVVPNAGEVLYRLVRGS